MQFGRSAPSRLACRRLTPDRLAPVRLAPARLALAIAEFERSAPRSLRVGLSRLPSSPSEPNIRVPPRKSAPRMLAPLRFALRLLEPRRSAFSKLAPLASAPSRTGQKRSVWLRSVRTRIGCDRSASEILAPRSLAPSSEKTERFGRARL